MHLPIRGLPEGGGQFPSPPTQRPNELFVMTNPALQLHAGQPGFADDANAMNYDKALRACSREAKATLAAAVAVTVFFWGSIFLFASSKTSFFGFPLWFMAAVVGGYLFSVASVVWIVKAHFEDIPLDITPDNAEALK